MLAGREQLATIKLNIAYPASGCQKKLEVDDEAKLRAFYDRRVAAEVDGEALGDEFKVRRAAVAHALRRRVPATTFPGRSAPPVAEHVCWVQSYPQGYVLKITGGQDKQGFAMKQGVLTNGRVRLLMTPGDQGFRGYGRRKGEQRGSSGRGAGRGGGGGVQRAGGRGAGGQQPAGAGAMARGGWQMDGRTGQQLGAVGRQQGASLCLHATVRQCANLV